MLTGSDVKPNVFSDKILAVGAPNTTTPETTKLPNTPREVFFSISTPYYSKIDFKLLTKMLWRSFSTATLPLLEGDVIIIVKATGWCLLYFYR